MSPRRRPTIAPTSATGRTKLKKNVATPAMTRMQREMKLAPMRPEPGFCNAPLPGDFNQLCRRSAGLGTDHPRIGPCRWHDPRSTQEVESRYLELISDTTLRDHLRHAQRYDRNLMDLEPEVQLVRALLTRHLNEYETLHDAFLTWAAQTERRVPPRALPDVSQVIDMVDRLSVLIQRIHSMRQKSSIDMATFRRVMEAMGVVVARHVTDARALEAIEIEWSNLTLNPRTGQRAVPPIAHRDVAPALPPPPVIPDEEEEPDS